MPKYVSQTAKAMLELGDRIIGWVKECAPYGSGNNHEAHIGDCEASCRTQKTLNNTTWMQKRTGPNSFESVYNEWHRPQRRAAAVIAYQAGNCQDLASLAYCFCRDHFSESASVKYVVNRSFQHAYVIVESGSDIIVVDPWPLQAQAVLIEDHICGSNYQEVLKNSSGLVSDRPPHARKKQSRVEAVRERSQTMTIPDGVSFSPKCIREAETYRYCASSKQMIEYCTSPVDIGFEVVIES
ncbi:hypothetical protein [Microbulbifer spongiae]|uniref:Transglutaminase-like domain-containing protein n=1 Tax=Microbulbifer spongiae TaxID=2944933 RepID=A0ABY9EC02_9GAMM|nr:hypothetical protein [Microbulbifer sp. MI-G]WKD50558.1 hypothetical protein M8T91_03790 [Microbulbifer sp. MI-G]